VQQKELALRRQTDAYREQPRTIRSIQEFVQRQLQQAARIQAGPKRGRDHSRLSDRPPPPTDRGSA
jgi:ATPase subunit of ABC transporter with duplicated ATPase domains